MKCFVQLGKSVAVALTGILTSMCRRQGETELRDKIQLVVLENRCYGYWRVVAALWLQGIVVNHKRVLRVMREDNLLSPRKRKFVVTTDSSHGRAVYPNLITNLH